MKTILTKVTYMAIGSLLTLIGYHFGNIDNNSADAQLLDTSQETEIVDEIRCRKLVIVGKDDTPRITLKTHLLDGGVIQISNENGFQKVALGVADNLDKGFIRTEALDITSSNIAHFGDIRARLHTDEFDIASLSLYHNTGHRLEGRDGKVDMIDDKIQLSVKLGTDVNGGYLAIFNKVFDTAVVQASTTNKGEGYVFTRDKPGQQTGQVGSPGPHIIREQIRLPLPNPLFPNR